MYSNRFSQDIDSSINCIMTVIVRGICELYRQQDLRNLNCGRSAFGITRRGVHMECFTWVTNQSCFGHLYVITTVWNCTSLINLLYWGLVDIF